MESDKSFDNPIFSFLSLFKDLRLIFHQIAEWILDIKNFRDQKTSYFKYWQCLLEISRDT